jgi:signal peptidase II
MLKKVMQKILTKNSLFLFGLILIFFVFVFDISTKRIAFAIVDAFFIKTGGVYNYVQITSFLNITRVINNGVSFGLFSELLYGQIILSVITIFLLSYIFYLLWLNKDNKILMFSYSLIIGGGLGNLHDRILFGGVFDFIDFHIGTWHYPTFNIADSCICIGVILMVLIEIKTKNKLF